MDEVRQRQDTAGSPAGQVDGHPWPGVDADIAALVPGFLRNRLSDVQSIRRHLEERAFREIERLGHKMTGSGESYGFPPITALGRQMEHAAQRGDADGIARLTEELHAFLRRIPLP